MLDDTIAAISTPIGAAGIGIIRVSGKDAVNTVEKVFRNVKGKKISEAHNHSILYGYITGNDGRSIDEVLVSVMRGPHSFTAEDVVEVNCHGGLVAVREVLDTVLRAGARPAEPGEFSKRAFLNGRIDLSQAESIIDLINAKTQKSLDVAVRQLEGSVSGETKKVRDRLLEVLAHIEAGIDFPEHDIEELSRAKIEESTQYTLKHLNRMIESAETGKILREGLRTVIIGKPNVGKSSLLNSLLRENRAIVTDIPGTTRDVIEEVVNIRGIPLVLVDTAGIRETEDIVEKMGVERSREILKEADLVLLMIDASTGITEDDLDLIPLVKGRNSLIIINKTDVITNISDLEIEKYTGRKDIIRLSLLKGEGLEMLEEKIEEIVYAGVVKGTDDLLVTNIRHKNALVKAAQSVEEVLKALNSGLPTDFMAIDIKAALDSLGEITGETLNEDLVDEIFSRFCIGK